MCVHGHLMTETEVRMASHIVRWWKTKFLTGYKQFTAVLTADCGDLRTSDTEELLRSQDQHPPPACTPPLLHVHSAPSPPPSPSPTPQPQAQPQPQPQPQARRELNFEGFECDVSLEGNGDSKDRQEFSFTLYDFDGHGKITKDDIAGLVTTIYDTLGSSIRVPHYGSKTIKVKLTVSPDPPGSTSTPAPGADDTPQQQQPRRYKRDLNVTIRERRTRPGGGRRPQRRHSISSSAASEDREADISEEEEESHPHPAPPPPYSRLAPNLHIPSCRMPSSLHSRSKKRSSSLQRQELLQIIQANMEKNNLCFKTSRKHYSPGQDVRQKSPQHCWERGRGRGKSQESPTVPPVPPRPCPPPPTTNTSPHYLKHRHREQEQARAMAQVVRWLEQEFSSPRGARHHKCTTEHHHVHEHVHHHYHHYQESPVLV